MRKFLILLIKKLNFVLQFERAFGFVEFLFDLVKANMFLHLSYKPFIFEVSTLFLKLLLKALYELLKLVRTFGKKKESYKWIHGEMVREDDDETLLYELLGYILALVMMKWKRWVSLIDSRMVGWFVCLTFWNLIGEPNVDITKFSFFWQYVKL